jgi:hypothetical protein
MKGVVNQEEIAYKSRRKCMVIIDDSGCCS